MSVTRIDTLIGWVWSILVDVDTTGSVVPTVKGGTTVSAFWLTVTRISARPLPVSWMVCVTTFGTGLVTTDEQLGSVGSVCNTRRMASSHRIASGFSSAGSEMTCTAVVPTPAGTSMMYSSVVHWLPSGVESKTLNSVGLLL